MEDDRDELGQAEEQDSSVLSSNDEIIDDAVSDAGETAGKAVEKTVETVGTIVKDTTKIADSVAKLVATDGVDVTAWGELIISTLDLFLKVVLPIILVVAFILIMIFTSMTTSAQASIESWYKDYQTENGKNGEDSTGDTAYEQGIFDSNYLYQDNLANPTSKTEQEKQSIYYNAVYQAYEMYKNGTKSGGFFSDFKNWLSSLFGSKRYEIPTLNGNEYNVAIDFSLMTSTLYANRMYTQTFSKDTQENFLKALESAAENVEYYQLHTTEFRDILEKEYFELALQDEEFLSDDENARVGIDAIQILSKYMIQRTESFYTLNKDIAGVTYDYTRNIKIINTLVSEECQQYILNKDSAKFKLHRGYGSNYRWVNKEQYDEDSDTYKAIASCESRYGRNLDRVDKAKFDNKDNVTGGWISEPTYALDCAGYKEYLLGHYPTKESIEEFGNEEDNTYFSTFIPIYYHSYVLGNKLTQESFKDVDVSYKTEEIVDEIYQMFDFYQNSTGNYSYCSNNYQQSLGDLSCGNGASGTCEYDNYDVYVYNKSGKTIAGPMSMGEYLTRVSYAEIGHIFSGGSNKDEIIKANMVIAKTYMLYHLNKGSNGATVDTEAKAVHVLGAGSGGFQAFSTANIPNLEHYVSLYNSISDYVLLSKDGGIFNANYAECSEKNVSKGVQNILYAFDSKYGGNKGHSSAALSSLKASGMNYQNATFTQILNYIISVGATNYRCSIDNYYSNATLGTCNQTSSGPGYISGGGSSDLPSLDIPSSSNSLVFYTQSTSSIGVSKARISFDGITVNPTDVYCAPASLAMIINRFGNFMYLNTYFYGKSAPSYNGVAIDSLFCKSHGKSASDCEKMMTVVKLGKYLIDIGKESPTSGALGAVTESGWLSNFGVKEVARVTNPTKANIGHYLSQGYVIIGHVSHHYIVIYGYDSATGTIYYHDPASQNGGSLSTNNLEFGYTSSRKSELFEYFVYTGTRSNGYQTISGMPS